MSVSVPFLRSHTMPDNLEERRPDGIVPMRLEIANPLKPEVKCRMSSGSIGSHKNCIWSVGYHMAGESSHPIAAGRRPSGIEGADGGGPSRVGKEPHQTAAHIAQKLRDAGVSCGIVNLVPTETAVLRRDRIVVCLALIFLTALAWSYLLWLSADMDMGGMDMGGFRMIPSGMGHMIPAHTPWRAMEFVFVFAMWTAMMVGMMAPSAAPMILMYARCSSSSCLFSWRRSLPRAA